MISMEGDFFMKTIGNILWLFLGGWYSAIIAFLVGALLCLTIIGIPVGLQFFKIAGFVLWPFGKQVVSVNVTGIKTILNIVWAILFGWEYTLAYLILGIFWCVTIIGIPVGLQFIKIANFVLLPLGRDFVAA